MGGRRGFRPISPISELIQAIEERSLYTEFQVDSFKTTAVIVRTDRRTDIAKSTQNVTLIIYIYTFLYLPRLLMGVTNVRPK